MSDVLMGVDCKITNGVNTIAEMATWSLTKGADLVKGAAFTEEDEQIYGVALRRWSISVSGMLDITDTNGQTALRDAFDASTKLEDIKAYVDSTHYYTTSASGAGCYISSLEIGADRGATVTISFTLEGSGILAYV